MNWVPKNNNDAIVFQLNSENKNPKLLLMLAIVQEKRLNFMLSWISADNYIYFKHGSYLSPRSSLLDTDDFQTKEYPPNLSVLKLNLQICTKFWNQHELRAYWLRTEVSRVESDI